MISKDKIKKTIFSWILQKNYHRRNPAFLNEQCKSVTNCYRKVSHWCVRQVAFSIKTVNTTEKWIPGGTTQIQIENGNIYQRKVFVLYQFKLTILYFPFPWKGQEEHSYALKHVSFKSLKIHKNVVNMRFDPLEVEEKKPEVVCSTQKARLSER